VYSCVAVCVCLCVAVCVVCVCVCVFVYMCGFIYLCVCVDLYICLCVDLYVCVWRVCVSGMCAFLNNKGQKQNLFLVQVPFNLCLLCAGVLANNEGKMSKWFLYGHLANIYKLLEGFVWVQCIALRTRISNLRVFLIFTLRIGKHLCLQTAWAPIRNVVFIRP